MHCTFLSTIEKKKKQYWQHFKCFHAWYYICFLSIECDFNYNVKLFVDLLFIIYSPKYLFYSFLKKKEGKLVVLL